jgi:SpoVK/Ycf46/Vps4 family AAA+-type ATPase
MVMWRVRDFHADDLDAAVRLWEDPAASSEAPPFGLSDLIAAVRSHQPAVVAVVGEELAGVAVATVTGDQAWVMRISLAAAWRRRGIGSAMLGELERRLVTAGVRRIVCLLAANSETGPLALEHSGFSARREMVLYERVEPVSPGSAGILDQLGGRMVRAGAWDRLGGMVREKELIERRVILPLAQPQLAERLGLVPPRAIVLFGPPGTGKTSFARGAASQLGWPFVELFPSRLAGESPAGLAAALREAFALVAELDKVVLFIDEVEEIAGSRQPRTVSAAQGVTNEMLKLIPAFREQDERLLICATNSVRALDNAFLRHGRFDYVLPIGPPDPAARQAIWDRYLAAVPHGELDMAAIVEESQLFTPADIEFAARRTAQLAFERVLFEHGKELVTTDDIRHAISQTRRTLTPELVADFEQDITEYARI